jgi:hypothetical protein
VPIDGATAIEHLARACLAKRSPALLLAELKGNNDPSVLSLIALLGLEGAPYPPKIKTVSLSEALDRVKRFFK